jgi:DNA-binding SARP family transcriptional activator
MAQLAGLARILDVRLLGVVELSCAGRNISGFPTRKSRSIFAFLALNRRKDHPRDDLAESFWPDSGAKRSRAALRTELWRIRSTIARTGADPHSILTESLDAVRFLPEAPCRLDIDALDDAIRSFRSSQPTADQCATLESAIRLYAGDLLEGDSGEWCVGNREYYRARYFTGLTCLIENAMATCDWSRAIEWCEALLIHDPLAEHAHRYVMSCHNKLGNRPAAIRQYARCVAILRSELNVEPMDVTQELHRRILAGTSEADDPTSANRTSAAHLRRARDSLNDAVRTLDSAIDGLADADR